MSQSVDGSSALPTFSQPPVVEVVVAVAFEPAPALALDAGSIYRTVFNPGGFIRWEEKAPYDPPIERFGGRARIPEVRFSVLGTPPSPRLWFMNATGSELVQLQRGWFARNWRKMPEAQAYPRYASIREPFERELRLIDAHCTEADGTAIVPTQCEVTYVNHISGLGIWTQLGEVDKVSKLWRHPESFLPTPEQVQFLASFVITSVVGAQPVGRLHVSLGPKPEGASDSPELSLTLTARGAPLGDGIDGVMRFLDLGHEWIVRGFKAMAAPEMLEAWGEAGS